MMARIADELQEVPPRAHTHAAPRSQSGRKPTGATHVCAQGAADASNRANARTCGAGRQIIRQRDRGQPPPPAIPSRLLSLARGRTLPLLSLPPPSLSLSLPRSLASFSLCVYLFLSLSLSLARSLAHSLTLFII